MTTEPKEKKEPLGFQFIYALKLENNKWYIGRSNTPFKTIVRYAVDSAYGPKWVMQNRIIDIDYVCKGDSIEAKKLVSKYARKYGIINVRCFCCGSIELNDEQMTKLNQIVNEYANPFM